MASLTGCGGGDDGGSGGNASGGSCSVPIVNPDATQVSVWGWYPNLQKVATNFNNTHDDVQVCLTNAGQGVDEYNKFQTAITAGSGAPDVIMLETDQVPGFALQGGLTDLSEYGASDVQGKFSEGAWKDVSSGDAVYGIPVDGGPMAMMYRTDIFEQYGLTVPTTWDEYRAQAEKLKAAGGPLMGDVPSNVPAPMVALMQQKGAVPWEYDAANPTDLKINLNDQNSKDVLDYWANMVKDGLAGKQDQFTTDYISGVVRGDYATYVSAAWAPGYLTGAGAGEGADAGKWAVAPLPQWDPANPVQVNWGGSVFSVTEQAQDKEAAAVVAKELYADDESLKDGWVNQIIFPLNTSVLTSDEFINNQSTFFNGQTANKDVYIPAADAYEGSTYSPFSNNFYAEFTKEITAMNNGEKTGSEAADSLQESMETYAEQQGFTLS
ncbi:extracellular solute-binding protein [Modestobacter sp. I12A-02628]|uniref:Extracellular solute-binding protein n=1 Tax=Goekera deserti TaxID=2497753 RepID=A0A7K3WIH1_9ACTN|nr:extracellular solute-binding protein [Goekera deserti]MPQ96629.1 extracellular solute-binding protein [Goekera deserti]NDI47059.1 extracellular solute-binding protein [Goekera deserti]NEL56295.1 extracellular solute-binding protein [Goekera deserti]